MKNFKKVYWFVIVWFLSGAHNVFAQNQATGGGSNEGTGTGLTRLRNPIKWDSVDEILNGLLDAALQLGSVVAVVMIIYAGLQFVLAAGNEEKIRDAKKMFFYTVIGIAVLFGAKIIAVVIEGTIESIQN